MTRTYMLGLLLAVLAGAGIVMVGDPIMYDHPEIFFGIAG